MRSFRRFMLPKEDVGKICPYLPGIVIPEPAWNRVKKVEFN